MKCALCGDSRTLDEVAPAKVKGTGILARERVLLVCRDCARAVNAVHAQQARALRKSSSGPRDPAGPEGSGGRSA